MELGNVWDRLGSSLGKLATEATKTRDLFLTVEEVTRLSKEQGPAFEQSLGEVAERLDNVLAETISWLARLNEATQQAKKPWSDG